MSAAALLLMSLPLAASAQPAEADSVYCAEQFRQWQQDLELLIHYKDFPELADTEAFFEKLRYSEEAIRDSLEGQAILWVLVAKTGNARCIEAIELSEHDVLNEAALEAASQAASQAAYSPATNEEGEPPFEMWKVLPLGFGLSGRGSRQVGLPKREEEERRHFWGW